MKSEISRCYLHFPASGRPPYLPSSITLAKRSSLLHRASPTPQSLVPTFLSSNLLIVSPSIFPALSLELICFQLFCPPPSQLPNFDFSLPHALCPMPYALCPMPLHPHKLSGDIFHDLVGPRKDRHDFGVAPSPYNRTFFQNSEVTAQVQRAVGDTV